MDVIQLQRKLRDHEAAMFQQVPSHLFIPSFHMFYNSIYILPLVWSTLYMRVDWYCIGPRCLFNCSKTLGYPDFYSYSWDEIINLIIIIIIIAIFNYAIILVWMWVGVSGWSVQPASETAGREQSRFCDWGYDHVLWWFWETPHQHDTRSVSIIH